MIFILFFLQEYGGHVGEIITFIFLVFAFANLIMLLIIDTVLVERKIRILQNQKDQVNLEILRRSQRKENNGNP